MTGVTTVATQVCIAVATLVAAAGFARAVAHPARAPRVLATVLPLTLEFLLAGGLLRLAAHPGLPALGVAAFVIVIRRVIGAGLRYGEASTVSARNSGSLAPWRRAPASTSSRR